MYKNIIFDLGGVMVDFDPKTYLVDRFCNAEVEEQVSQLTFESEEWKLLDAGLITRSEANLRMLARAKEYGRAFEVQGVLDDWMHILRPRRRMQELVRKLKSRGYCVFSPAEDGKFTAQYGYSASYPADDLNDEIQNMLLPLLDLPEGSYTDLAASLSAMMVQSYGVAIVKPAEGKTQEVVDAMDAYIQNQQQTMEHYLEDQYQIAASAKVATVPTGEVVMVCCENSDAVMNAIKTALAA